MRHYIYKVFTSHLSPLTSHLCKLLFAAALLLQTTACIVDYTPEGVEEVSDLLIVDGTITNDISAFRLGRSVGLTETLLESSTRENGASLYVEADNGQRFQGTFEGDGLYTVATGTLESGTRYRLCISVGGESYESTWLAPLFTPEIDSITPEKRGQEQPVYMCVSTHDDTNQSHYYRWAYKEHWEIKAELQANAGWTEETGVYLFTFNNSNNTYYCWRQDTSKVMLLGSSEKLTQNIISMKRLTEIEPSDRRLSVLYYIAVEQMQIRKEAYDYFSNMQKNVEQTGSIFSPVPSEMSGNISCITNADLPVVGYVEVTTTTRKHLFVPENAGLYEPPYNYCYSMVTEDGEYAPPNYGYYQYNPPASVSYAPWVCVDCTQSGGTKNRPGFWPNEHY